MKLLTALISTLLIANLSALPLTPETSTQTLCSAVKTTNTYNVEAVCWRNKKGEARLYFLQDSFQALKETNIKAKHIENTEEACGMTYEYSYDELFGANKLMESEITPGMVTIKYSHLDLSSCFN